MSEGKRVVYTTNVFVRPERDRISLSRLELRRV
jgi:hypothetical protein